MRTQLLGLILILVVGISADGGWWLTIPSANNGCGSWTSDSYYWDTQDTVGIWPFISYNSNDCSGTIPRGDYGDNIRQYFCTGKVDSMPLGSYCFYQNIQNAQSCPTGFTEGTRTQNDEDDDNQSGSKGNSNTLPKKDQGGYYNSVTKWYFCCGSGTPSTSISFDPIRSQLPDTFMLLRKGGSCQVINGRNSVQTGSVYWDDEDDGNANSYSGTLPDGDFGSNTRYYYCTYGPSFLPFSPTNLQVTQRSSTSVDISWIASEGSGVYYKILTSPSSTQMTKYLSTSITLNSLSPSTTYAFYIYAGKNNPSNSAETYETVGTLIQFRTCNTGYGGLSCDQPVCNPTCVNGNCIGPNQCSCDIGWGGSRCNECTNGYYPNGNGNCLECNDCNNHGICSDGPNGNGSCICNTGYTTHDHSNDYCSICTDGYVMENSMCVKCFEICDTCEFNSTFCTSCKSGYTLQLYNNTCTSSCEDGTYFDTSSCTQCPESCSTCYGGDDNQCLSCPNGKVLESSSCLSNCSNGNYPDSNRICQGCEYPCSTCFGSENGKCLSCISPLIKNGTTCISEFQCNQNGFIDSNRNCQECDPSCLRCYGPNENQCLSCSSGKYLLNGECLNDCPTGYYSNSTSNTCQSCNNKCLECFGVNENECLSCNFPLLLNSTSCISTLECSNFGYKDNTFCLPCNSSCQKCNGPLSTSCVTCPDSKYLFNGECLDDCPFGYFISGSQCQACSFPCLGCENESTKCLDCVESFLWNDTACISNDQCSLSGYAENGTCYGCNSNCSTCYGPLSNNCLSCLEPKVLLEETCADSCPSNYVIVNQTNSCQECDSSCMTCSGEGSNNCLSCENNLYFYEGQCLVECPVGFYPDSSLFICNSCPSTCLTCTSPTKCMTCASGYSLFGGECVDQCPDGFTSNNAICSQTQKQTQNQVGLGVGLTFLFLFLILLAILVFFFIKRQKKKQKKEFKENEMIAANQFYLAKNQNDTFSTRPVSIGDSRSIDTTGQATIVNTQIDISIPGFLKLNVEESLIIGKVIGNGGGGDLYAAEVVNPEILDKFNERFVVVKYLKDVPGQSKEVSLLYFHDEITINWALNFEPNIIKMVGYSDEPKCLVTKLYERDLFSLLHDPSQQFGLIRKLTLALHISKGIQSIHRIKAAHRDIKTKNILIERGMSEKEEDIRAVICDFGLAIMNQSRVGRDTPLHTLNGLSIQYAPPEAFKNKPNSNSNENNEKSRKLKSFPHIPPNLFQTISSISSSIISTTSTTEKNEEQQQQSSKDANVMMEEIQRYQKGDIFAFGVVLWEIITRQIPWNNLDYHQIEHSIKSGQRLEIKEGIELSSIEKKLFKKAQLCWNEDPSQRPTISSLVSDIETYLSEIVQKNPL